MRTSRSLPRRRSLSPSSRWSSSPWPSGTCWRRSPPGSPQSCGGWIRRARCTGRRRCRGNLTGQRRGGRRSARSRRRRNVARHLVDQGGDGGGEDPAIEPTLVTPPIGRVEYVPPHSRVVSDQWIRNRIISAVAVTCFAANIVTWLTTREVNSVLVGAGISLLLGVPLINRGDRRGD